MALVLFLLASLFLAVPSQAALRKFNLTMTRGYAAPDCNKRPVILVNGQFTGPTIRVNTGDDVEILVTNRLIGEELSIHWHGIFQKGTPWMDGPAFVTQCPILSGGNSFTYRFSVENQVGTFWWHAHNSILRTEGVMGAFIIDGGAGCEQEPYVNQYNEEILISLTDWYHLSTSSIITGLDTPGQFTFPGNGNSILINGKGQARNYQNSSTVFSCVPTNCTDCPREVITVEQGKRYRLRIINMAALGFFNFAIEGHSFTVVEADGTPTKPVVVQTLDISAGQRYSVILNADQPKADYWITVQTRWRASPFTLNPSGTAVLHYAVPNSPATPTPTTPIPDSSTRPLFDFLNKLQTLPQVAQPIPRTATKTITLKVTQQYYPVNQSAGGQFRWPLNGTPYFLPSTPALWLSYLGRTNRLPKESKMISLNRNDVVDIIIQNGAAANGVCENHPWHLHGHGMWVIGAGNGTYPNNPTLSWTYNSDFSPIFRDTVTLIPSQFISGTPTGPQNAGLDCGWLKLRFRADNPGTWFFHCHVEWHMHMGMGVVFETAPTRIPDPPSDFPPCGIVPFSTEGY